MTDDDIIRDAAAILEAGGDPRLTIASVIGAARNTTPAPMHRHDFRIITDGTGAPTGILCGGCAESWVIGAR